MTVWHGTESTAVRDDNGERRQTGVMMGVDCKLTGDKTQGVRG